MTDTSNQIAAPIASGTGGVATRQAPPPDEGDANLTPEMRALIIEEGPFAAATLAT